MPLQSEGMGRGRVRERKWYGGAASWSNKKIGMKWNEGASGRFPTGDAISQVEAIASTGQPLFEAISVAASHRSVGDIIMLEVTLALLTFGPFLGSMIGTETCSFKRTFLTSLRHRTSFHVSLYELITVRDERPFKVE